jgi:hypothetical protein
MKPSGSAGPSALAAVVAVAILVHAAPGGATTYNVSTASGLVSAVADANANLGPDTINLAPGYYLLGSNVTPLTVTDDLTVNGGGRPGTVLDGGGSGGSAFSIHASFGGNPYNPNIHATFNDLTIENFHPGIDLSSGPTSLLLVNRTTITGSGTDGFELAGGPVEILNSTISGNGRGILIESGDPILLDNDTIVGNVGNGIEEYGSGLTVRNTIIANNGSDCASPPDVADHDINGDGSCGSGFITADPMLGALADNGGPTLTRELLPGSPAIDAGSGGEPIDQRGVLRPQGGAGDIGAFEWTAVPFKHVSSTVSSGGSVTTDTLATGATPADPVQTSVTAPNGGTITIEQGPGAADFGFLGQKVQINAAPDATAANPFAIVFVIDASVIPSGESAATIVVDKNGVVVPPCTGSPGIASPDPCVASRLTIAGGDAQIAPNPIRRDATVRFSLPTAANVDLSLFDLAGRKVATLVSGHEPAGRYLVEWHAAEQVPAGLYFARFSAGTELRTATVVRVN